MTFAAEAFSALSKNFDSLVDNFPETPTRACDVHEERMNSEPRDAADQPRRPRRFRCGGVIHYDKIIDMTQEELEANAPQSLPTKRSRSLTIKNTVNADEEIVPTNASVAKSKSRHSTCLQYQSLLMRLPVELRRIIWEEAICGNIIHIAHYSKRLLGVRCTETIDLNFDISDSRCWSVIFRPGVLNPTPTTFPVHRRHLDDALPANILALSRTCRLM
jgi:hypothetical protein